MVSIKRVPTSRVRELQDRLLLADEDKSTWRSDGVYWGAFDGETLIAFAGLVRSAPTSWPGAVFLHASGVVPEYRGKGLQKRLVRARLAWARRNGFTHAFTYTVVGNVASERSLISCGFKPYRPQVRWVGEQNYWCRSL